MYSLTTTIICRDGQTRTVSIKQDEYGYHAFLIKEDGETYSTYIGYATCRAAIKAASKW